MRNCPGAPVACGWVCCSPPISLRLQTPPPPHTHPTPTNLLPRLTRCGSLRGEAPVCSWTCRIIRALEPKGFLFAPPWRDPSAAGSALKNAHWYSLTIPDDPRLHQLLRKLLNDVNAELGTAGNSHGGTRGLGAATPAVLAEVPAARAGTMPCEATTAAAMVQRTCRSDGGGSSSLEEACPGVLWGLLIWWPLVSALPYRMLVRRSVRFWPGCSIAAPIPGAMHRLELVQGWCLGHPLEEQCSCPVCRDSSWHRRRRQCAGRPGHPWRRQPAGGDLQRPHRR